MKIPVLNIYVFTKKSFQKKQLEIEKATRAVSNKIMTTLLHENMLIKNVVDEVNRKYEKANSLLLKKGKK